MSDPFRKNGLCEYLVNSSLNAPFSKLFLSHEPFTQLGRALFLVDGNGVHSIHVFWLHSSHH